MMQEKIEEAKRIIKMGETQFKRLCVLSSFGKDSIVLLHLIQETIGKQAVVFFSYPQLPLKLEFSNQVIQEWNLEVHRDIPPIGASIVYGKDGDCEVMHHFQMGAGMLKLPVGHTPFERSSERPVCGRDAYLQRPFGTYYWQWDGVFIGHKRQDKDNLMGELTIDCYVHQTPGCASLIYPLLNWTDADIWEYTQEFKLPINRKRYDETKEFQELEDKTFNNDYYPYCNRCFNIACGKTVYCPKIEGPLTSIAQKVEVTNLSDQLTYLRT